MSILPRLRPPRHRRAPWHPDDLDREAELEYRADEARRFAADPSDEDIAFWSAATRDDDDQMPDDLLDAMALEAGTGPVRRRIATAEPPGPGPDPGALPPPAPSGDPPMWTFSNIDRLEDLIGRSLEAERYLTRERCDRHDPADRLAIDRRLVAIRHRLRRLRAAARAARRKARAPAVMA